MTELLSAIRFYFNRFLIWSAASIVNLIISLIVCIGLWFGFNWLAYSMPAVVSKAAIDKAYKYAAGVGNHFGNTKRDVDSETAWFVSGKGYVEDINSNIRQAQSKLIGAQNSLETISKVSRDPDEKLRLANQLSTYASEAETLLIAIDKKLNENRELKTRARRKLQEVQKQFSAVNEELGNVQTRYDNEAGEYLPKYTSEYQNSLTLANQTKIQVQQLLGAAVFYLPDDTATGNGDPTGALQAVDQALSQLANIQKNAGDVVAGLNFQAEAKRDAEPTTQQAENLYFTTLAYVNEVKQNTQYWLNTSFSTLASAKAQADSARALLNTAGGIDYPEAFKQAQESINFSNQARSQADGEVATAQYAINGINTIDQKISALNSHVGSANGALDILRQYHHSSTWSQVAGNIDAVASSISNAQSYQNTARQYVALDIQRFSEAKANVDAGLNALSQADNGLMAVESLKDKLENIRRQWSSCEAAGQSGIDSAADEIRSYGGYSSSAKSDYSNAGSLLDSARQDARSGLYEQACAKAKQAGSDAQAAGAKAKRAYDAEQERIAEEKRRKEREERERQERIEQQKRDAEAQRQREAQQQRDREAQEQREREQRNSSSGGSGGGYSSSPSNGGGYNDNDYGDSYNDNDF